jgi:hypothetical protein
VGGAKLQACEAAARERTEMQRIVTFLAVIRAARSGKTGIMLARAIVLSLTLLGLCGCAMTSFSKPQSASEVLQGLKDKGLPIGESVEYTAENDPNDLLGRPNQYTSKVMFNDTRLKPDPMAKGFDVQNGGSIEVFEDEDEAIARAEYLENVTKSFAPFAEYSYREGTVLLRLSHRLTPDQAAEYEDALKDVT